MGDLDNTAKQYLELLGNGNGSAKPWAFANAIEQCKLDGSEPSLSRIENLLSQIQQRYNPDAAFLARADVKALLQLLAFYVGNYISQASQRPVAWYSHAAYAQLVPPDQVPDPEPWSEVIGVMAGSPCVPLGVILDMLSNGKDVQMGIAAYAARLVDRFTPEAPMEEHERCQHFLKTVANGEAPKGGMFYLENIVEMNPDFSPMGLSRLDMFLDVLRNNQRPDLSEALGSTAYVNFLLWCSYYLAATIAQQAKVQMKWLSYDEARALVPNLQRVFVNHHVCLLEGSMFFPLNIVCGALMQIGGSRQPLADYVRETVAKMPIKLKSLRLKGTTKPQSAYEGDPLLYACFEAGKFASMCLSVDSFAGRDFAPRILQGANPGEKQVIVDYSWYESPQKAHEAVENTMTANPEKRPFLVHAFDSYANLVSGRKDALTAHLKVFPPRGFLSRPQPVELMLLMPYRKPGDKPFVTYNPVVQQCGIADTQQADKACEAFMDGVASFQLQDFSWRQFLDPSDLLNWRLGSMPQFAG